MTDWQLLGGEDGVRHVVDTFVGRFFDDLIIGFLFAGKDRERIVLHETELASLHLGGPLRYGGRGIASLHGPLRINRGHFRRRLAIVRQVLQQHGAPDEVTERWIAHEQRLESVITDGTNCIPG
jgi:truncated hemoglobin YjbI